MAAGVAKSRSNSNIECHQVLHGYKDGHQLLASSLSLPRTVRTRMLLLTDLSGPSVVSGFESYLTGYPLPEVEVYAFSRTWYAQEMPRPGCVWTHTLLLSGVLLASVRDLSTLIHLFARPQQTDNFTPYEMPINVDVEFEKTGLTLRTTDHVRQVIAGLYGRPEGSVIIGARAADDFEAAVLAIWSQQWPRLRRSFSFCTGSLGSRGSTDTKFDLEIVPETHMRQFRHDDQSTFVIPSDTANSDQNAGDWIDTVVNDIVSDSSDPLRAFLWEFGEEYQDGRRTFSSLVQLFKNLEQWHSGRCQLAALIERVARRFPAPKYGTRLKTALFGSLFDRQDRLVPRTNEIQLLRELVTTEAYSAFDAATLDICQRGKTLWKTQKEEAKKLIAELEGVDLNPLADELLKGLSESISEDKDSTDEDLTFLKSNPKLLRRLVKKNPFLAQEDLFWRGSPAEQRDMLEAFISGWDFEKSSDTIVFAILSAGANSIARELANHLGKNAILDALDWFNVRSAISPQEVGPEWRDVFASSPTTLVEWLSENYLAEAPNAHMIALIAGLVDPHSAAVQSFGVKPWLRAMAKARGELDRKPLIKTMTFCLALAFDNPGPESDFLAAGAFQTVHDAAEANELEYESWQLVKDQAPSLGWWWEWDKCERLRRALIDRFLRFNWAPERILRAVEREETFRLIIESCKTTAVGRDFIKNLRDLVVHVGVYATDAQRDILFRAN